MDETSAKAHAASLFPIFADDVIDGERYVYRAFPGGGDVGLVYQFRLRPRPVPNRPLCEMRTVFLGYEFAQRYPADLSSVDEFDLLAMKRAGGFRSEDLSIRHRYRQLTPDPQSDQEHAARCAAVDLVQGWLDSSGPSEFQSASFYVSHLRAALADNRNTVRLRCIRDRTSGCPVTRALILEIAEAERREFNMIALSDGTQWAQFTYYDDPTLAQGGEMRNVIIEMRVGEIVAITLVYHTMVPVMI